MSGVVEWREAEYRLGEEWGGGYNIVNGDGCRV